MYDSLLIDFFVLVVFLVLSGMVILVIPATLLVNQQLAIIAVKLLLCCRNQFKSLKKDNKIITRRDFCCRFLKVSPLEHAGELNETKLPCVCSNDIFHLGNSYNDRTTYCLVSFETNVKRSKSVTQ